SNDSLDYVDLARTFSAEFIVDMPNPGVMDLGSKNYWPNLTRSILRMCSNTLRKRSRDKGLWGMGLACALLQLLCIITLNDPDRFRLVDITIDSCRLTHTHPEGILPKRSSNPLGGA
ncbi:unnamed protein product, partial [Allacma fusca]